MPSREVGVIMKPRCVSVGLSSGNGALNRSGQVPRKPLDVSGSAGSDLTGYVMRLRYQ